MRCIIDAWLERRDPCLRLLDADTGKEILRCGTGWIIPLLESGELSLDDIQDEGLSYGERLGLSLEGSTACAI
ncbi:hypothetical protein [Sedimenticola selenatireducens]|uniref:Uncharacterized protein n=1 Tax=Sedimenticola selenatireducens TaxID=191960 RepID=A0A557SH61_9GAMM|nr:hypothetical protein [Sedimenticola selenatireducens]TVO76756.1 hypothetical protein FHP88_04855 [Sedimenticola selenatireducens]TVT64199.1 MAG: hypothetical protein FHK78_08100 [Sedimenticola selenatireducens]